MNNIEYGPDYIEIWGVKFSREKLIPQVKFNENMNENRVFKSDKNWVFKVIYTDNGNEEYYFTEDAYADEVNKQWKIYLTDRDLESALSSLNINEYKWEPHDYGPMLWYILNLNPSGKVYADGDGYWDASYSYLGCVSYPNSTYLCNDWYGYIDCNDAKGEVAYPCLFVVK